MKYLTPTVKILSIDTGSPIALSFGGGTESVNANYIQYVEINEDEDDEEW